MSYDQWYNQPYDESYGSTNPPAGPPGPPGPPRPPGPPGPQ
ncbi:unnamed protein product, partial [Rotaria sp. Silwood1]